MTPTLGQFLVVLGVLCILGGVVGGGVKALGFEISTKLTHPQRVAVGMLGAICLGVGIGISLPSAQSDDRPAQSPPPRVVDVPKVVPPAAHRTARTKYLPGSASPSLVGSSPRPAVRDTFNGPSIQSVSTIHPTGNQVITIEGSGFGSMASFNGRTPFLRITNLSHGNWSAGWRPAEFDIVGGYSRAVLVSEWSDSRIVVEQIADYGTVQRGVACIYTIGDVVKIEVANPHGPQLPDPAGADPPTVGVFTTRVAD
jgi:hypothetical protein